MLGLFWGASQALRGAVDAGRGGNSSTPQDPTVSPSSPPQDPTVSRSSPLIDRLAQPAQATYEKATFSITSVKVGDGRVVLTVTADNSGSDQELEIADCCILVEQPTGKLRKRSPFDSGGFPHNFMLPIPARNRITDEVIFTDGGLDAATTTLVVTLALPPTVDREDDTVLQFKVQLTTGR